LADGLHDQVEGIAALVEHGPDVEVAGACDAGLLELLGELLGERGHLCCLCRGAAAIGERAGRGDAAPPAPPRSGAGGSRASAPGGRSALSPRRERIRPWACRCGRARSPAPTPGTPT